MKKSFLLFLIIQLFQGLYSRAQLSGEIYYLLDSTRTVINFGPCYMFDEVYEHFVLKNTGNGNLRMLNVSPSIEIYASPDALTEFEYLRFSPHSPALPFNLNTTDRKSETLVIKYTPLPDLLSEPLGRKTAMMKLGLVDPMDTSKIIVQRTFKLIAKKTLKFIDGYDDLINFDSVFINTNLEYKKQYRIRNTQASSIKIIGDKDSLITQNFSIREFLFENKTYPFSLLPKNSNLIYEISYKPYDLGCDTAIFRVFFIPREDLKPDSTDFCSVRVVGCGVHQKLSLVSANANFFKDTIFLGDIPVKKETILKFKLRNDGNIPYGAQNQFVFDNINSSLSTITTITQPFPKSHLRPDNEYEIIISIKPDKRGFFNLKYVIENDLPQRKIFGYNFNDTRKEVFIIGRAVEPEIFTIMDTIDFGNVFYSPDLEGNCPNTKDTLIKIFNIGNTKLYVNEIKVDDEFRFSISKNETQIDSNNYEILKLTFTASYPPGIYYSKLKFINNSTQPKDTFIVILRATSVPPILAKLSINNNIKSKPGRTLDIPIVLSSELYKPAIYAKFYEFDVGFNPTMLKYIGKTTLGTASEGASVSVDDRSLGKIKIKASSDNYLLPRDTLIILKFKTFLGDNISSELAIQNTIFGSGNCRKIYDLVVENGKYTTDSICGLNFKINPIDFSKPTILSLQPNPAIDKIDLVYYSPKESINFLVKIFNFYGQLIKEFILPNKIDDLITYSIDLNDLSVGYYFIMLTNNTEIFDSKTFIVTK